MTRTSTVRIETSDGIAILTLDKPPVNAIDLILLHDAETCLRRVEDDKDTRAVVITGSGACFSAGLDLRTVPSYGPAEQRRMVETLNRSTAWLYGFRLPTVAAINGHAIAGGFIFAIACDYRIGTDSPCKLGVTESRVGIPFPFSTMEVLRSELAPAVVRRMTLVGHTVGPEEALAQGVLDDLQPADKVLERAKDVAHQFASMPAQAYFKIKRQLRGRSLDRMAEVIRTGSDPLLKEWITEEGRISSARHLNERAK